MTYYISMTHKFYSNGAKWSGSTPALQVGLMGADDFHGVNVFETRADAEARIDEFNNAVYLQMHNEIGRPALRVKTPSQLTDRQRDQLAAA